MPDNGIATAKDFRRVVEHSNAESLVLPASGLSVRLCRPPVFAALAMGRTGTLLQARVTDVKPEEIKAEDVEAFTAWLTDTLTRLFLEPRFAEVPEAGQIGLADILIDDLKFIFRWLRGEVFSEQLEVRSEKLEENSSTSSLLTPSSSTEDLSRFPGRQGSASVLGGSGKTQPLPSESITGTHGHAGLSTGLHRR